MTKNTSKRKQGETGITDGLTWKYLSRYLKLENTATDTIMGAVWWWRRPTLDSNLLDFLNSRRDRGVNVGYIYESVSRLNGKYLLGKPFSELTFDEAEGFSSKYVENENPAFGYPFLKDEFGVYCEQWIKPTAYRNQFLDLSAEMHEVKMDKYYSPPFVIRFNLHQPAGTVAAAVKKFVEALQDKAAPRKRGMRHPDIKNLETWDIRRWTEDDPKFLYQDSIYFDSHDKDKIRASNIAHARSIAEASIKFSETK